MASKSMTDVAFEIMSSKKRAVPFAKLWEDVSKAGLYSNENIAQFYNDLALDSRFVSLKDGKWDLKTRRKFGETYVDIANLEVTDEPEEGEEGENEEEEELDYPQEEEY